MWMMVSNLDLNIREIVAGEREIISVNLGGEANFCSFDIPFTHLNSPGDLILPANDGR